MHAAAKSLQSCPTLCDPIDSSPPGSPVLGILQSRTLEWVAISFSNAWKWKVKVNSLSYVRLLATPWTAAYQAPPFMGFARQEYWSGLPLPSPHIYIWYIHMYPYFNILLLLFYWTNYLLDQIGIRKIKNFILPSFIACLVLILSLYRSEVLTLLFSFSLKNFF